MYDIRSTVMQINIKNIKYNVTGRNDRRKQAITTKYISSPLKSGEWPLLICLQRLFCLPMEARYASIEIIVRTELCSQIQKQIKNKQDAKNKFSVFTIQQSISGQFNSNF